MVERVLALPDYRGPTLAEWEAIWAGRAAPTPHWPTVWPDWAVGDPSAVQLRHTFKAHGISAPGPDKVRHAVVSGQDVLRALIWSGEDRRRFVLHPRCTATREALENYRALDLGEGVYDARPDPDPANHVYSHGTDQAPTSSGRCGAGSAMATHRGGTTTLGSPSVDQIDNRRDRIFVPHRPPSRVPVDRMKFCTPTTRNAAAQ